MKLLSWGIKTTASLFAFVSYHEERHPCSRKKNPTDYPPRRIPSLPFVHESFPATVLFESSASSSKMATNTTNTSSNTDTNKNDDTYVPLTTLLPPLAPGNVRIYLLRHGETDWNKLGKIQGGGFDIPLNENGRLQAEKVAAELDGIPLGIIASSSLSRAKETADILYQRHANDVDALGSGKAIQRIVDEGFNEMRFGTFEGYASATAETPEEKNYLEYFKECAKKVKEDPTVPFPGGGESTNDVKERTMRALHKLLQEADPTVQHIAVVSHGRTNKVIIAACAFDDVQEFKHVKQSNTAINVLDMDPSSGKFKAQIINHIEHVKDHVIVRLYPHHK
mmetsp:Transcript_4669/g.8661  ORF Transcript_4669/g.8661 Transcript_4669/m.8661 type:complete len:337 (-) Transcript_4669:146-1156(-)